MLTSKWSVNEDGSLIRPGISSRPARIIYVEDHSIFSNAIKDYCIKPFFKNSEVIHFDNGDDAFTFLKSELRAKKKIDMILTDINHPGMRGQELVKCLRHFERLCKIKVRIPIMVLSMVEENQCPELMANHLIDFYLQKTAQAEEIVEAMEEMLFPSKLLGH